MLEFYVTMERRCMVVLCKRLITSQIPFWFNGGRILHFRIEEGKYRWIKPTMTYCKNRCKQINMVFETEVYKDGMYVEFTV